MDVRTVSEHLKNIFASGELDEDSGIRKFRITAAGGKSYATSHYNLYAIISVGHLVNSVRATQFRQWATQVLREFAIKGYVMDSKRMENGAFLETGGQTIPTHGTADLVGIARASGARLPTYGQVAAVDAGVPRAAGAVLNSISRDCEHAGEPDLTALVVDQQTHLPGTFNGAPVEPQVATQHAGAQRLEPLVLG